MMKRMINIGWMAIVLLGCSTALLHAQSVTMADLPYLCDFEDEAENARWVLNPSIETITTANAWSIGKATAYTGSKALYVSGDGGVSNTYAATNNVLIAYRDITLDQGDYDIAYDWTGLGNGKDGYLKIVYVNRPETDIHCSGNGVMPDWVKSAKVQLTGNMDSLVNGDSWMHVQTRITIPKAQANKTTTRICFVWVNTSKAKKDSITTVVIDNFQLAKAVSATEYASNIHVSTLLGSSTVTWDGDAEAYEVMYRKKNEVEFASVSATGNSVTLENVDYGAYEFWICAVNGTDKSVYTVFPVVYIYETDCFDALNMYNATFEYGRWAFRTGKEVVGTDRIDYGNNDRRSRHTTHFDKTEIDPRTVIRSGMDTTACLHTVPEGEFGSVRLGNWLTGSEYESMTFTYQVESHAMAVLLIRYAIVLENPDHNGNEQPRFTLDVLDEQGKPVDANCASVDFHAPTTTEMLNPEVQAMWHTSYWTDGGSSHEVTWQDWKTIGISVDDYVGQTLTIVLTSYDCDQGGHFGYAYFTLNCVRSDVDGLPWGESSTTRMFTAPQGFDYAWFNRTDTAFSDTIRNIDSAVYPYITEGGRYFYIQETDTNTYLCHVTYPTNAECGYWFDASGKPHTPRAELGFRWTPENCRNGYRWWNRNHVVLTNQITGEEEHRYDKQLEIGYLFMEDGTEQAIGYNDEGVYVPMPDEGGTVRYGVWTGIYAKGQLYADTAWYEWTIPAIGPQQTHLYDTICRGENIIFPDGSRNRYMDPGDYSDVQSSRVTGCDSTIFMHLHVHEPLLATVYDTICPGTTFRFGTKELTASGKYTEIFSSIQTGCDSMVTLNLTCSPRPAVQLLETQLCGDDSLKFAVSHSFYTQALDVHVEDFTDTTFILRYWDAELYIPLENTAVGTHDAVVQLRMPWCDEVYTDTIRFGVSLANNLVELLWGDVLVFLDPDYNGGLAFTSYQWYADGQAIEGANQSYYYNPAMDMDTEYTVRVTMANGAEAWVCPFKPGDLNSPHSVSNVSLHNAAHKYIRDGQLVIRAGEREYNAVGVQLRTQIIQ